MPSSSSGITAGISVDHVAHFVPDSAAAAQALTHCGFTLTPFSEQSHRTEPGGPLVPAGTANRIAMLRAGYVEFLTPLTDTPNARQLHAAMTRYMGVHLIAFGTQAPQDDYARLAREGFAPLPPIALQREGGSIRFTVVRVPPGTMAEGRIQYCQHHTPDQLWQPQWTTHANHAVALAGVLIGVADPSEAAQRYARFTGLPLQQRGAPGGAIWRLDTARGCLWFMDAATLHHTWGATAPTLPWIAGYVIDSDDMQATAREINARDVTVREVGERLCVSLPPALGGMIIFQPQGCAPWA